MKIIRSNSRQRRPRRILLEFESGQAIVILALAMVGLLSFTALAIDGANALYVRRNMQNAADASVVSGLQGYLAAVNAGSDEEEAVMLAAQAAAESNTVDDSSGTTSDCSNTNVYVWYINDAGEVLNPSTGATTGAFPAIGDGMDIQSFRSSTDCASLGTSPIFSGIHVTTRREFDTFLAGLIGHHRLAAEGASAAIIRFDNNGCNGAYAAFGLDENNTQGTLKLTGTNPSYDVTGDFYAADEFQMSGSGTLRIEGDVYYVNAWSVSTGTDVWIGPHDDAGTTIGGNCNDATTPGDWTYWTAAGEGEICYASGLGYQLPQQVPVLDQPYSFDYADFQKGGEYADDAAGCDTTVGGCQNGTWSNDGKTFERWGNDYYYYSGTNDWTPTGTLPTGIFVVPNAGIKSNATFEVNQFTTFVAGSEIAFTGAADVTVDPSDPWQPYGGIDGSGVTLYSNVSSGNAILLSGASLPSSEGIFYAPGGDCQISGSQSYSGAFLCNAVDSSGSTGSVTFDIAYCPPPRPTIVFRR